MQTLDRMIIIPPSSLSFLPSRTLDLSKISTPGGGGRKEDTPPPPLLDRNPNFFLKNSTFRLDFPFNVSEGFSLNLIHPDILIILIILLHFLMVGVGVTT